MAVAARPEVQRLSIEDVERDVRLRLFRGLGSEPWRVGAEMELLALRAATRAAVPIETDIETDDSGVGLLDVLRKHAVHSRWLETRSAYGSVAFTVHEVGIIAFEPGGQIELSTFARTSPSAVLRSIRETVEPLRETCARQGIVLLEVGLDPWNSVAKTPLQLHNRRYSRMAAHFARVGNEGARMMRQSASCQFSVDVPGTAMLECWRTLNAAVPALIATFANSPMEQGQRAADASCRARIWQGVDTSRTGIFTCAEPLAEYGDFALNASAFLLGEDGDPHSFREWVAAGAATRESWEEHLSTLFPEVRPRGHLEFRACDAIGDDARAALLVVLCAVARDARSRAAIVEIVGSPNVQRYSAAPSAPADLVEQGAALLDIALAAARREPAGFWSTADLDAATRFMTSYPRSGRVPADDFIASA